MMLTRIARNAIRTTRGSVRSFAVAADTSSDTEDIKLVEKLLDSLRERQKAGGANAAAQKSGYKGPAFNIKTFNNISPKGLQKFSSGFYKVSGETEQDGEDHAILLRSHKLQVEEIGKSVRAVARCGAGVNNIPVSELTELGIPVFNTPGSNANSVKELVLCALLLSSRDILGGIQHVKTIYDEESEHAVIHKRVEKEKKLFVGQELQGKTLGVVGLGNIGSQVVNAAMSLGMDVIGYDPMLTVDAALALPHKMNRANDVESLLKLSDYVSLHVPYNTHTHHLLGQSELQMMKPEAHLMNFSRGELVDSGAMARLYETDARSGKYISDFVDEKLSVFNGDKVVIMPHLGASTGEAEENSARMAAEEIRGFLERGSIVNSVNFPTCELGPVHPGTNRLCIVNRNVKGVLGNISTLLSDNGINILKQVNVSREDIAYTAIEFEGLPQNPDDVQIALLGIEGVISSRFVGMAFSDDLYGIPGTHYKTQWRDGQK